MKMNFLVFGPRGSGKDTITEILIQKLDNLQQMRLAKFPLAACKAFGIEEPTKADLVKIGSTIGRNMISKYVWINMALKEISNSDSDFIISDARFHNEYETFLDAGFFPIFITAPLDICKERVVKRDGFIQEELFNHESEQNYHDFVGYRIRNIGTIKDLEEQVDLLLELTSDEECYNIMLEAFKNLYEVKQYERVKQSND